MYGELGAREIGTTGVVEFRLFIPDNAKDPQQYDGVADPKIAGVAVVGTFQKQLGGTDREPTSGLPMELDTDPPAEIAARGRLYRARTPSALPEGFYAYKYYVYFQEPRKAPPRYVPDPCTRYGGKENDNSAIAVGGRRIEEVLGLRNDQRKPPQDLVIYDGSGPGGSSVSARRLLSARRG